MPVAPVRRPSLWSKALEMVVRSLLVRKLLDIKRSAALGPRSSLARAVFLWPCRLHDFLCTGSDKKSVPAHLGWLVLAWRLRSMGGDGYDIGF
jgi:hypothetical protein